MNVNVRLSLLVPFLIVMIIVVVAFPSMRTEKLLFFRVEARLLPLHHPTHLYQHHRVQHVVALTVLSLHSASLLLCTTKED